MRALLVFAVLISAGFARAEDSQLLRNRYGNRLVAVYGVGDLLYGSDATMLQGAHPYRRFGGAIGFGVGADTVITSFGALAGFEADAEVGASTGNLHSDGVLRFNETSPRDADSPPLGLSLKLGGRVKLSPLWFHFGDDVGLRLGLTAGLAVDWFGVEAYDQVGSYDVGAQFVFQASSFSITAAATFTPPQGEAWELTRLKGSLMFVFGQFVVGARASLTNARFREATTKRSAGLVAEQTFSAIIGVALGD